MGMRRKVEVSGKSMRSLKAYLVSRRCPRRMWAIWKARMALRLPICWAPSWVTTAVVSMRLLELMMVLPTASDSSGSVSRVADADGPGDGDVVIGEDIAGERLKGLVEVAGSVEQTGLEEAVDDVILGLLHPGALCAERADILRVVADVGGAFDLERGVFGLAGGDLRA